VTRIALLQTRSGVDPAANAQRMRQAIADAAGGGATMLFTPEMSGLLDSDKQRMRANLKGEEEDATLAEARAGAALHHIWVHVGSLAIARDDGAVANRAFVIDPSGTVVARYDKLHLFDVDLPTGESWRESATYRAGEQAVVVPGTPVGTLGLAICYDLRFPALFERLTEAGADTIAVPAAFTVPTGQAHWHVLLRARAIEAGRFIIAAAQQGEHEDGRATFGHSLVIDPWGEVLLDGGEEQGTLFADIELDRIGEVAKRIPVQAHRRPIPPLAD
jgi:predicted amidohydrolase